MATGLGLLRLPPEHFWRMTPRELAAALGAHAHRPDHALHRGELDALMMRFPDEFRMEGR